MAMKTPTPRLIIYRGFPHKGCYVWSPFVTKLEARLRFAGLAYKADVGSPRSAPRGKIPYVGFEDSPDLQGDTTLMIRQFVDEKLLPDLNAALSPVQQTQDLALRALLEDKVYFYQGRERWCDNYYTMRSGVLGTIPYPIQLIVGLLAYRSMVRTLYGQGTGRYTDEEMTSLKQEVWQSINTLLSESKSKARRGKGVFWALGGAEPSEADPVVFGFVASALVCQAAPETQKIVRSFPVIMDYARRIHDQYFIDYDLWEE